MAEDGDTTRLLAGHCLERKGIVPLLLVGLCKLDLDPVDAVYAINEQDQDEDKGNLHPIL